MTSTASDYESLLNALHDWRDCGAPAWRVNSALFALTSIVFKGAPLAEKPAEKPIDGPTAPPLLWMLEVNDYGTRWWAGDTWGGYPTFTDDANEAVRFTSQEQAQRVANRLQAMPGYPKPRPTAHLWMGAPPPERKCVCKQIAGTPYAERGCGHTVISVFNVEPYCSMCGGRIEMKT